MRRRGRGRLIAAAAAALVALALAGLWSQRKPIAIHYADRALAARGVPARYRIARLGVWSQRLEQVSLGDPRAPNLTADWVELHLAMGLHGPSLTRVRAGGVRLRGRLADGRLSLGAVDRLLPKPSGGPLALPELDVDLSDARMRLETPYGVLGLALDGRGNLADGFRGRLAVASNLLAQGGCRTMAAQASLTIRIADRRPTLAGPVRADWVACGDARVAAVRADLAASLDPALQPVSVRVRLGTGKAAAASVRAASLAGAIDYRAGGRDLQASPAHADYGLTLRQAAWRGHRAMQLRLTGGADDYGPTPIGITGTLGHAYRAEGRLEVDRARVAPAAMRSLLVTLRGAAGSPLEPVASRLARAAAAASDDVSGELGFAWRGGPDERWAELPSDEVKWLRRAGQALPRVRSVDGVLEIARLNLRAASGATLWLAGRRGLRLEHDGNALNGPVTLDGEVAFGGGGLPDGRLRLDTDWPRQDFAGTSVISPYVAGSARLALAPVRFVRAVDGTTRIATTVTLSGPLGDGRVEELTLPVAARLGADGSLAVNETCAPLGLARLAVAGLVAGPTRLTLCPDGGALFRRDGRGVAGGGTVAELRLAGRIGGAPATIAAQSFGFGVGRPGFVAEALALRFGAASRVSRLDVARLAGGFGADGVAGRFAGLGGRIGGVPLIVSDGAGPWQLARGVLGLGGRLRVADEADPPRFNPLVADDAVLRLAGGRIAAGGTLREPTSGIAVAKVAIRHDLAAGRGDARLDVPGLAFTEAFQPERLTRLTLGVVANVRGSVAGEGTIRWTPAGVTSGGRFSTEKLDLAAAFGPVTGIKGALVFTDLLGLVSAPGQAATVAEVNPGIAVTDGIVRYRLLPDQKVAIEGARWPFSGGTLTLAPTVLDFAATAARRMTFRVDGMDAAKFVEQFDFKNVAVTGVFDGTLPIVFDAAGGRIERGRLEVRRGGGTLAYVGEVSNKDLGMFGSLAFDALKRMRYDRLAIELNGSLDGELISRVLFDGTNETPKEAVRKNGLLSRFSNLPFRFTITIRAPFRGLLNAARSLNDPRGLIEQARTPAAPLPGSSPVQPK